MNIKKQEIINKLGDFYKKNPSNSIIICEDLGLNAFETKNFKFSFWNLGNIISIKNTLFECFLKEHHIDLPTRLFGNNIIIFCKDPLKTISSIKTYVKKNKTKKIQTKCAFIEKKYFNEDKVKKLEKYNSTQHLHGDKYLTLKSPMIMLTKILSLAAAEKN